MGEICAGDFDPRCWDYECVQVLLCCVNGALADKPLDSSNKRTGVG